MHVEGWSCPLLSFKHSCFTPQYSLCFPVEMNTVIIQSQHGVKLLHFEIQSCFYMHAYVTIWEDRESLPNTCVPIPDSPLTQLIINMRLNSSENAILNVHCWSEVSGNVTAHPKQKKKDCEIAVNWSSIYTPDTFVRWATPSLYWASTGKTIYTFLHFCVPEFYLCTV